MRVLHTSDWHLGRTFHRVGMLEAQAAYVDHLLETVEAEKVDLVVVSGDVYDRALPPVQRATEGRAPARRAAVVQRENYVALLGEVLVEKSIAAAGPSVGDRLRSRAAIDEHHNGILLSGIEAGGRGQAVEQSGFVVGSGQASISYLQRRLRIGFSRAARLIDMMEMDGIVSAAVNGKREVLVDRGYFDEVDAQVR